MSSIASLYIVKADDLPAILDAVDAELTWEAVEQYGAEPDEDYHWSGNVMSSVLDNLAARDVILESSRLREAAETINRDLDYTILIDGEAKGLLDRLDPAGYEPGALVAGTVALRLDGEEARHATDDTLSLLRETITRLADDDILLIHIG
ncbi:hypothetical protein [Actinoplanes philippinensis]|uniref:hypothetical protein n=1 Tax=Actinoplanes philippinensis TaxID=35752 RepID=UPI0033FA2562